MANTQKDTIYIDIDDEITAIIDKVRGSDQRIVALVLPKRAAVLQSVVNMKLLKRSAEAEKKHIVLITSESGLLPLAGMVGLYVAPTLQSRPVIPAAPGGAAVEDIADESADFDPDAAAERPIGELAGPGVMTADDLETIELDNEDSAKGVAAGASVGATAAKVTKPKKNGKLKIPDFNKFRLWLVLGGVAFVALLVFGYFAAFIMPKATVTIATDSSDITTNANITLDPNADELDLEDKILPAKIEQKQQAGSQQVAATGQRNKGEKATGTVTLSLKDCSQDEVTIPAGTGVSSSGKTFITQSATTLESVEIGGRCRNNDFRNISTQDVDVVAQTAGAAFNIGSGSFTVAGFSGVAGESSDGMSGGTDNIVKVVSQSDIDSAKQKITSEDTADVKADLKLKLENAGYMPIEKSVNAGETTVTPSASVGDEADTVTITSTTAYTMYGIKKADIEELVEANVEDKIDPRKQKILNKGIDKASFDIASPSSNGRLQVSFSATTLAGPDINTDELKQRIKGKKTNDVRTTATATPGVTDVSVEYSPFWVSSVPSKEDKITIVIEKAPATSRND